MTSHITSAKMNEICIKKHSEECENDNGDYLINFRQNKELSLQTNALNIKNHIQLMTWQQTCINKETNKTQHIQEVLHVIMIENQYSYTLQCTIILRHIHSLSSQTNNNHNGNKLEVSTQKKNHGNKDKIKTDTQKLVHCPETQTK